MTLALRRYTAADAALWNDVVARSRNGTFLFDRQYMDYHAHRFEDHSLVLESDGEALAVLPAHRRGAELVSHGGLTYGGFVVGPRVTLSTIRHAFDLLAGSMSEQGLSRLIYKTIPAIYHVEPSQEDLHALFLAGAAVIRRDVLVVIDNAQRGRIQERRSRSLKKAIREGLAVTQSADYTAFWNLLRENLDSKYKTEPVHSEAELVLLAGRFPSQISLVACHDGDRLVAGVVTYLSSRVLHLQYIASSEEGRSRGALDAVIEYCIARWSGVRYFDFGAVTESDGRYVNAGLVEFKEGFGGRTVVHDHYRLDL
jgi:hypothetical protein